MKSDKNHQKHHSANVNDVLYAEELHELADAISDIKQESSMSPFVQDPFDEYMNLMSSKIFLDSRGFRSRFIKGYNTLLHQIELSILPGDNI